MNVGLLVFPYVQQLDLTGPYEVFASAPGFKVDLVWKSLEPLVSATGLILTPTMMLADCPPLEVICVPGGVGVNALLQDGEVLDFIRRQAAEAKFITSVCTGALVLGAAGLLRGRRATTHWASHDLLASFGAIPIAERVVRDDRLITGGGVTAGIDFALTVVAALRGQAAAEAVQLELEYAPASPFDSGTPDQAGAELVASVRRQGHGARQEREEIIAMLKGN